MERELEKVNIFWDICVLSLARMIEIPFWK